MGAGMEELHQLPGQGLELIQPSADSLPLGQLFPVTLHILVKVLHNDPLQSLTLLMSRCEPSKQLTSSL